MYPRSTIIISLVLQRHVYLQNSLGSPIQIIRTLFQGTLGPLYWTGRQKRYSGYQLLLNSSPWGFSCWKTTLYHHLSWFYRLTGHSWEVSQVDWCWSHLGAWLNLTSKMAYSQSWQPRLAVSRELSGGCQPGCLHVLSPCGWGLLQHGSTLRLNRRCQTSSSVALGLREHHSHHILLSKSSAQMWTLRHVGHGGRESLLRRVYTTG